MKIGFFGGKLMGHTCLQYMIDKKIIPKFVLVNDDDDGNSGPFYESTKKLVVENHLNLINKIEDVLLYDLDIIISIGYAHIIKKQILEHPKIGIINAHPAPLPKYRGRFSTMFAIINGETEHGITFHFMNEGIDSGDIVLQKIFQLEKNETGKSLYLKSSKIIFSEFKKLIQMILENKLPKGIQQKEKNSSYYKKQVPNDGFVNLEWDEDKIDRHVRALYFPPFDLAKIRIGKKKFNILPHEIEQLQP